MYKRRQIVVHQLVTILRRFRQMHHQPRLRQHLQHQPKGRRIRRLGRQRLQLMGQFRPGFARARTLIIGQQIQHQVRQLLVGHRATVSHHIVEIPLHQGRFKAGFAVGPALVVRQRRNSLRLELRAHNLQLNRAHFPRLRPQVSHHLLHQLRRRGVGSRLGQVIDHRPGIGRAKVAQVVEPLLIENIVVDFGQLGQPVALQQVVSVVFPQRQHHLNKRHRQTFAQKGVETQAIRRLIAGKKELLKLVKDQHHHPVPLSLLPQPNQHPPLLGGVPGGRGG